MSKGKRGGNIAIVKRHNGRLAQALFGAAGVVLAVGLGGAGILPVGTAAAAPVSQVVSAPSAAPIGSEACIIGLNCGCIRYRTCPGDRRRAPVRTPEPQQEGDAPGVAGDHGVAPVVLTRTPVWVSPSA